MRLHQIVVLASLLISTSVVAQVPTAGTLLLVRASGEVSQANDEVTVTFKVEETGRDKAGLASRVNEKMKQGIILIRAQDPSAKLKTRGYSTNAVYKKMKESSSAEPEIIGWKVEQSLEATTGKLSGVSKMATAAQGTLGVSGIDCHLSAQAKKLLDEQRIAVTYQNLNERIASVAKAMGRKVSESTLESVDFENAGGGVDRLYQLSPNTFTARELGTLPASELSLEPGETTLQMQVVGKVRFK